MASSFEDLHNFIRERWDYNDARDFMRLLDKYVDDKIKFKLRNHQPWPNDYGR